MCVRNDAISANEATSQKMTSLEAMRGIASIVVLFHHFCLAFLPWLKGPYPEGLSETPFAWIMRGESAVVFFFVLSGFVLALKFYQRPDYGSLLVSAVKRLPRLMGPAAVAIICGFLILRFHLNYNEQAATITGSEWLRTFGNSHFPQDFTPTLPSAVEQFLLVFLLHDNFWYNSNLWTMTLEYYGSLCVFLVCGLTMPRSIAVRHVLTLGAVFIVWKIAYSLLPFVIGAYLALVFAWIGRKATANVWIGAAIGLSSVMMLCSLEKSWQIAGSVGLMICLIYCPRLARPLSGEFGRLLGRFSFPLYLVHFLVIVSVSSYGFNSIYVWTESYTASVAAAGIITLLLSIAAAVPLLIFDERWVVLVNASFARLVRKCTAMARGYVAGSRTFHRPARESPIGGSNCDVSSPSSDLKAG